MFLVIESFNLYIKKMLFFAPVCIASELLDQFTTT
jgi:hypothetical protein